MKHRLTLFVFLCSTFNVNCVLIKLANGYIQSYSKAVNGVQTNIFKVCWFVTITYVYFTGNPICCSSDQGKKIQVAGEARQLDWNQKCHNASPPKHINSFTVRYPPACLTNSTVTKTVQNFTSEDCLYVNIFADSRCSIFEPCPIIYIVTLHGSYLNPVL